MKHFFIFSCLLACLMAGNYSCKPPAEKITLGEDAKLAFSADSIIFDTIFTSVGSITRRLLVHNRNKNAVNIGSIKLGGMAQSDYSVIINGREGYYATNTELRGGDSMFILVRVKINPQDLDLPYLVKDSLLFNTNNNEQKVMLIAFGQDANFIKNEVLACNTTWDSPRPYVIWQSATVSPGCVLTIKPGVKVLFHDHASFTVKGTLKVEGEAENIVVFRGDKSGRAYEETPGQWRGITIEEGSVNNRIQWAHIKNAETGIQVTGSGATTPVILDISESIVQNMSVHGLEAINANLSAVNCLFNNCASYTFTANGGGKYALDHCTFANYSHSFFRNTPALELGNMKFVPSNGTIKNPLDAVLRNCIIWGDMQNEINLTKDSGTGFHYEIHHSIVRTNLAISGDQLYINQNPEFVSPPQKDFMLKENSPALNAGIDLGVTVDLNNKARANPPDIGAYEFE